MELIEIKEILRKASIEVDIQGHGKHTALFETDFERVAIDLVKKLTLTDVSQHRELLIDFLDKLEKTSDETVPYLRNSVIVDMYLKGNL